VQGRGRHKALPLQDWRLIPGWKRIGYAPRQDNEWVQAVNEDGRFGKWGWDVSKNPADRRAILERAHG